MRRSTLLGAAVILAACSAHATVVVNNTYSSFSNGGAIPDDNPAGFTSSETVSGVTDLGAIDNVTVSLNISGGFNGDLYGYLVYQGSGNSTAMAVLLNHPGLGTTGGGPVLQYFGYSDAGMNVTLNDTTALTSIQNYGGTTVNSGIPTGTYNSAGGTLNSAFNGVSADGTWTLALFNMSSGGGTTVLNSWNLNVDETPEPITWALIIFGAAAVPFVWLRRKGRTAAH